MFSVFEYFVLVLYVAIVDALVVIVLSVNQCRTMGEGWSTAN